MIEKMVYINISGRIDDLDRVIEQYLSNYDIQLEDPFIEADKVNGLTSFNATNPYIDTLRKAERLIRITGLDISRKMTNISDGSLSTNVSKRKERHTDGSIFKKRPNNEVTLDMSKERALEIITKTGEYYDRRDANIKKLEVKREIYREFMSRLEPFQDINFKLEQLAEFKFIKYRFGKMPKGSYKQFKEFLDEDTDIIFFTGKTEGDYIYAFYFVPESLRDKADSVFSSLHFERIWVSYELDGGQVSGTPSELLMETNMKILQLDREIQELHSVKMVGLNITREELASAYAKIKEISFNYETRNHTVKTKSDYYIFAGWMPQQDALALKAESESDEKVILIIEQDNEGIKSKPPTQLKNFYPIKPFEFFVRLYGLPSYGEIDPTPFIALTYTVIFGIMFGDLGQGAVLVLLGLYLKRARNMALGAIMSIIGMSSMVFGVLYGSVFGIEDVIPALWLRPHENVTQILVMTVIFGVFLILVSMVINILNSVRSKNWARMTLNPNGFAGMIFYLAVIFIAYNIFSGGIVGSGILKVIIAVFIVLPLLSIWFEEPIFNWLGGKKQLIHGGTGQFLLESFIGLFEVLMSFFSNTLSFVRVGAFALSHAGMMSVVIKLSTGANDSLNPVVLILGNLFVLGLEGLVVGIQVLRLEFYEMFGRFFVGGGRDFKPQKKS